MISALFLAMQAIFKQTDNNLYLNNFELMIKFIAQMDLEYQSCYTFVVRYLHIPPFGSVILAVTIGRTFLFLLSSNP